MPRVKWLDRTALRLPHLALVTSDAQFRAAHRRMRLMDSAPWLAESQDAAVHRYSSESGRQVCIVCIRLDKKRSGIEVAAVLAHEAVHVKQILFEGIGETAPSREIEAYVVENATHYLLGEYARQMRLPRQKS